MTYHSFCHCTLIYIYMLYMWDYPLIHWFLVPREVVGRYIHIDPNDSFPICAVDIKAASRYNRVYYIKEYGQFNNNGKDNSNSNDNFNKLEFVMDW